MKRNEYWTNDRLLRLSENAKSRYNDSMQCNIDAKGKAMRLIYGLVMLAAAAAVGGLIFAGVLAGGWVWLVVTGLAVMGGFGVFEARAGWCAVRAMGFKTRY